jgi:uncharacterized membrane protein YebE (DUF533 family)
MEVDVMPYFSDMQIAPTQALLFARGLYALARVDGIHEHEMALIGSFVTEALPDGAAQVLLFSKMPDPTPDELAGALDSDDLKYVFLRTALLLALADGEISYKENAWIYNCAAAMGLKGKMAAIEEEMKDYLLGSLSHVQNTDALRDVAKELKY